MTTTPEVTETTRRSILESTARLPFGDRQDFEDAARGFIARATQRTITATDGRVVWDLDADTFVGADARATANPGLWRQSRLLVEDGLFVVVPGNHQVRVFDTPEEFDAKKRQILGI